MTAVQALVAMGTFALSVLAPAVGLPLDRLGLVGAVIFGVGALSSAAAGALIARFGDLRLAALCILAVALAMLCLALGAQQGATATWTLWPAAVLLGLAFGPETPASASVLSRITPLAQRPWVFSIRQTGNQIGAMGASLVLPLLQTWQAAAPFAGIALLALWLAAGCEMLHRREPLAVPDPLVPVPSAGGSLATVLGSRYLRLLTLATVVFMATQVCLNFFLVTHLVTAWSLPLAQAAAWVALMQAAGLAGRLLWGRVARGAAVSPLRLIGGLGVAMGAAGLLLLLATPPLPVPWMALLFVLLGLSASGWNGVMVAEIARVAGTARAGAVTGTVLLFGYGGLTAAPLAFVAGAAAFDSTRAYAVLLAASLLIGLRMLAWRGAEEGQPRGT